MQADAEPLAELRFEARIVHWRGPSPYFFVPLPADAAEEVRRRIRLATYGWGMAPVEARIGEAVFRTSLFPREGTYFLPLKDAVRRATGVTAGDAVAVALALLPGRG